MEGLGIRRTERVALHGFDLLHEGGVVSTYPERDLDSVVNRGTDHWPLLTSAELPFLALRQQQRAWDLPVVTE